MKISRFNLSIILGSAIVMLSSCMDSGADRESSTEGYSKVVMYSVDKNSTYFEDLEDEDFTPFGAMGEEIIQDVLNGKLKAYQPFNPEVEMTLNEVKAELFSYDTVYVEDTLTYDLIMTVIENDYSKNVESIKFKERWKYESGTGVIDKVPVAVAPRKAVLSPTTGELRGYTPLFWVKFE